jgi:hypothetical protein
MTATLPKPLPASKARIGNTVDVRFARAIGCKENTAHQLLWNKETGLRPRVIAAIESFRESPDSFAHWWAPIELAVLAIRAELDNNLLDVMAQRDADEDVRRQRYFMTGESVPLERSLELEIEAKQRVLVALRAKRGV